MSGWHSSDVAWFADRAEWRDLAGFVMVETVRTVNGVEGKPERRCFITSLKADARAFRKLVRRATIGLAWRIYDSGEIATPSAMPPPPLLFIVRQP